MINTKLRNLLNKYQERVYKTLESYFDGEEKDMLREATRPVGV